MLRTAAVALVWAAILYGLAVLCAVAPLPALGLIALILIIIERTTYA